MGKFVWETCEDRKQLEQQTVMMCCMSMWACRSLSRESCIRAFADIRACRCGVYRYAGSYRCKSPRTRRVYAKVLTCGLRYPLAVLLRALCPPLSRRFLALLVTWSNSCPYKDSKKKEKKWKGFLEVGKKRTGMESGEDGVSVRLCAGAAAGEEGAPADSSKRTSPGKTQKPTAGQSMSLLSSSSCFLLASSVSLLLSL